MNREDFQKLSHLRVADAAALLAAGQYAGSRYLLGYAVECALKACIAKNVKRHDFPPRDAQQLYVHRLEELLNHAKLRPAFDAAKAAQPKLANHWNTVKDWREDLRYSTAPTTLVVAQDYFTACTARSTGVLSWIKKQW